MKVGFVLDDTLDGADGVQQYILLLGSWLARHGHDVHYLTTQSSRTDIENLHSLGKHLRIKFNRNVVPLVLPTSARRITEVLQREQFDVLHVQMPYGPAFGARVISLAPATTAVVGTFHIAPYSKTEKALSSVLGYWLKPSKVHLDAVMSVSLPAQKLAADSFGLTSTIIPNMVDVASYRLAESLNRHEPTRLIFVGRLVERKGCEHLIRSLALVNAPFKLTVVGDGNQRDKLAKLCHKLKLNEVVTFAGFVDESQKRKLLSQSDIAIFPATGGESFGIVLIEAMAAGSCIVLAGNNPGYASVMGETSEALVDPLDHHSFAKDIETYIQDKTKALNLYKAQQKLVKQYDVEAVAPAVLGIYQKAIANRAKKSHTKR
jgi:phosphatidylinositol alpha-mannosyltransferase